VGGVAYAGVRVRLREFVTVLICACATVHADKCTWAHKLIWGGFG